MKAREQQRTEFYEKCGPLDWRQGLGMNLWYRSPSTTVSEALEHFEKNLEPSRETSEIEELVRQYCFQPHPYTSVLDYHAAMQASQGIQEASRLFSKSLQAGVRASTMDQNGPSTFPTGDQNQPGTGTDPPHYKYMFDTEYHLLRFLFLEHQDRHQTHLDLERMLTPHPEQRIEQPYEEMLLEYPHEIPDYSHSWLLCTFLMVRTNFCFTFGPVRVSG
jgi:hypothetical protein